MIRREALQAADEHWAVRAIGADATRALAQARSVHAARALQNVMQVPAQAGDDDLELFERVSLAYEMAAMENLDPLLGAFVHQEQQREADLARAGAHRAFEVRRILPIPVDPPGRMFHVLHLLALAYTGERWTDAQRWLREQPQADDLGAEASIAWDEHISQVLYRCWLALLRKDGWDDLQAVQMSVMELRAAQARFEPTVLEDDQPLERRAAALRLVALYNWARATEVLGVWLTMGPAGGLGGPVDTLLDQHMETATAAGGAAGDVRMEVLLRWLHVAARQIAAGALWSLPDVASPQIAAFVDHLTRSRSMFELLPPQLAAFREGGLLDQAARAVVIDMPTSGGKTALAEFRILQALQFAGAERAWVAYVAPTRALVSQITRRLRRDLGPTGLRVEALSAAIEIDELESQILLSAGEDRAFDILVCTPEKLAMVVRNAASARPMALVVIDEAHNIEDPDRGLSLELLLATLKRDSPETRFLLLMPYVPNVEDLQRWLSSPGAGRSISLGTVAWQPNERVIGMFEKERAPKRGDWTLRFQTLITTQDSVQLEGQFQVGRVRPLSPAWSSTGVGLQAAAMASVMSTRGTSVAVGRDPGNVWKMARHVCEQLPVQEPSADVALVQRYLATEVDPDFELIGMLDRRIGVHHSGLSDETRTLMEYLAEDGELRVLCATTSIAQGIDFPISSVFLASTWFPGRQMTPREFWNLAGRAGRVGHDSVGVVGLAAGEKPQDVMRFVSGATGDLASRLQALLRDLWRTGRLGDLRNVMYQDEQEWRSFRSYVAHLWAQKRDLEAVIAETDGLLRSTFGYSALRSSSEEGAAQQAQALRDATFAYVRDLSQHPENATLADSTGFSPEGVRAALLGLGELAQPLAADDWKPQSLFGGGDSHLSDLVGVMMKVRELEGLEKIAHSGLSRTQIARIAQDWVAGNGIAQIARDYFAEGTDAEAVTAAITTACRGIYRILTQAGSWGLAALSRLPTSGVDWEALSDEDRRRINLLPAFLYHGVSTEAGVLMRVNAVPRSVAESLGERFVSEAQIDPLTAQAGRQVRDFLSALPAQDWAEAAPAHASLSGDDYQILWRRLSGVDPA
jgi:superfamily II DNA/RNA helicase